MIQPVTVRLGITGKKIRIIMQYKKERDNMKRKLIALILSAAMMMVLSSCENKKTSDSQKETSDSGTASDWNPDVPEQEELKSKGCLCGVYYMNYAYDEFSDMKKSREYYEKIFTSTGTLSLFPFLKSIPDDNIVSTPMGSEIYLIIPADPGAHVDVYLLEMDEESFDVKRKGDPIYSDNRGLPFVLQCNYSDIFSETEIVITDSNGDELVWSPSVSLRDGKVNTASDDGVYDYTEYAEEDEYAEN